VIGQRKALSKGDIQRINNMYDCKNWENNSRNLFFCL
jgi:hypothetical protein